MKYLLMIITCSIFSIAFCACGSNSDSEMGALRQEIETLKQNYANSNIEIENLKQANELLTQENESLKSNHNAEVFNTISDEGNVENEQTLEGVLWEFIKPEVASELTQPTTAEFSDVSEAQFYKISNDTYEVLGSVTGQNAMGNTVSNNFCATVILDANSNPTIVNTIEFLGETEFEERMDLNKQLEERVESGKMYLTTVELEEATLKQPMYVKDTKFLDSSAFSYSSSSMLQAILYNNSEVPIKSASVAFVAWDENKLPLKIEKHISISDAEYFSKIEYDTINLMPEDTYTGEDGDTYYGMQIDENVKVSYLKAIVISYEDFDGNTWENPLILDFKHLYEEKRLVE